MLKSRVWFLTSFSCFNFVLISLGDETTKIKNDLGQTRNTVLENLENHSVTVTRDSCINTNLEVSNQYMLVIADRPGYYSLEKDCW